MRWNVIGYTCLLLGIVVAAGWAQPKIEIDNPVHDFGTAYPNEDLYHPFVLTNVGNEPLQLLDLRTTCGCTGAILSASEIQPGATSIVSVTMTANSTTSTMSKDTIVRTNAPQQAEIRLTTKAEVRSLLTLEPERVIDFEKVTIGQTKTETIYLKSIDGQEFNITNAMADHPAIEISVGEHTASGYPINVTFTAPSKKENVASAVRIETDHPKQPVAISMVYAVVTGYVEFLPQSVYFGIMREGDTVTREVRARLLNEEVAEQFSITDIVANDESLTAGEVVGKTPTGDLRIKLTYQAPAKPGYHRGELTMVTNLESEPELDLRYSALVRRN